MGLRSSTHSYQRPVACCGSHCWNRKTFVLHLNFHSRGFTDFHQSVRTTMFLTVSPAKALHKQAAHLVNTRLSLQSAEHLVPVKWWSVTLLSLALGLVFTSGQRAPGLCVLVGAPSCQYGSLKHHGRKCELRRWTRLFRSCFHMFTSTLCLMRFWFPGICEVLQECGDKAKAVTVRKCAVKTTH